MKIQEVAKLTGLTAYTIRFYEKEGLLDLRHIRREANNYRNYSEAAIERLRLVKKFQGVGCSLAELKDILRDKDTNAHTNQEVIEWIRQKMREIDRRKDELDQMLGTLQRMMDYRMALMNDPQTASALFAGRHVE